MSKMKHLLRKLHIGSATTTSNALIDDSHRNQNHHQTTTTTTPISPNPNPSPTQSQSQSQQHSPPSSSTSSSVVQTSGNDFNFLEEEFQVQLALAISASDQNNLPSVSDPETAQIDAAKRISLNQNPSVDFLSLRYWSYNVVDYTEKVMDGFYDVCGSTSSAIQGKMPTFMDLQGISLSANVDCQVILVNRLIDSELQALEKRAYDTYVECQASNCGPVLSGLIQKIANIVVERMGGPVGDANEIMERWTSRSYELRKSLNSIILPLGCLDVGLSRHRALLFKVLADRINLPCMMVKGSYYTGTDDGAVNFIKINKGSEYIIDLMGAPGALIPAEVPTSHLSNLGLGLTGLAEFSEASLLLDNGAVRGSPAMDDTPKFYNSRPEAAFFGGETNKDVGNLCNVDQTEKFEKDFGSLLSPINKLGESSSSAGGNLSAQRMKVNDVSKYVISAAKDPEFAQKLHAVLLESGASLPMDLFVDNVSNEPTKANATGIDMLLDNSPTMVARASHEKQTGEYFVNTAVCSGHGQPEDPMIIDGRPMGRRVVNYVDFGKMASENSVDMVNRGQHIACNGHNGDVNPMLGEVAEILWEDLQIGERIGIGSYGEVYHADLNGTEVAVKRLLDQDFSGDALDQFKSEIEIMLRLRHPNVVLFMGAVARPPNFSIVTEYLPRGSLYRLLHRSHPLLDGRRRIRMALDVAKGMNYLHTSNPIIVHRDLKTPNLLVDKNWIVKVCDFGLSRMKHHTFLSSKSSAGTPEWMAPEVLRNEPANEKCDVYSFGVILWELATQRIPWKGLNPMQVVGAVGFQNKRLEIPEDIDPAVADIIRDCWQMEPHLRPSFTQIVSRLRRYQRPFVDRSNSSNQTAE